MPIKGVLAGPAPVKLWIPLESVESQALDQLRNTARMPFIFKHVAAMPDVHLGIGATVGSVIATKGAVMPAAVGVDIGCGMMAAKINLTPDQVADKLPAIRASIERGVPVGRNEHRTLMSFQAWPGWETPPQSVVEYKLLEKAGRQVGTLGGGNHFIEVCLDQESNVWIMLHSGSRNVGKRVAEIHIDKAKTDMRKLFINLPDQDLAYFAQGTPEFNTYLNDVTWCQEYARINRRAMFNEILKDLSYTVYGEDGKIGVLNQVECHHNYIAREHHFGENVIVTRKGAVRAQAGDLGIIPGSMGTRSYIVRGLGQPDSFNSCSHGAGRRMSRRKARETFTKADLEAQTAGVECRKDEGIIDEIPGAYKDIDEVMENQNDLVEVVYQLKAILCVKG